MSRALAVDIAAQLTAGVARNGRASLVASGGTTPGDLYDILSEENVPWDKVSVTLSDERWTDPLSPRSNEHLIRTRLLQRKAAAARLVPFKTAAPHADAAEVEVDAAVSRLPRPFDVVLLGMGTDLHTASLIPGSKGLERALDPTDPALVRAVHPPELANMGERMTLTLRAILDARWIVVLVRGEAKLKAYDRAMTGDDLLCGPVRAVLRQDKVPVAIYWSE
ncbi:MAG: 6-phosphogluconolactonase [Alphaproteobacteria bacterium]|nr:6-phosphogluconolactonase [Alphaproteobacteria bacterium]